MLTGLFDEQVLLKKLDQNTDPLARLNSIGDWQIFLPIIEKALGRENAASAGRKPYPPLLMFKILIPLSEWEKQGNRTRSRICSRVEHIFGSQLQGAGTLLVCCIGLARARVKIGLRNLAYNMARLGFLAGAC